MTELAIWQLPSGGRRVRCPNQAKFKMKGMSVGTCKRMCNWYRGLNSDKTILLCMYGQLSKDRGKWKCPVVDQSYHREAAEMYESW